MHSYADRDTRVSLRRSDGAAGERAQAGRCNLRRYFTRRACLVASACHLDNTMHLLLCTPDGQTRWSVPIGLDSYDMGTIPERPPMPM